jgi:hypothetical protein
MIVLNNGRNAKGGNSNSRTIKRLIEIDSLDVLAWHVVARKEARSLVQVFLSMTRCDRLDILSSRSICTTFLSTGVGSGSIHKGREGSLTLSSRKLWHAMPEGLRLDCHFTRLSPVNKVRMDGAAPR